ANRAWHSPRPLSAAAIVDGVDGALFIKRHHHSVGEHSQPRLAQPPTAVGRRHRRRRGRRAVHQAPPPQR
ncbi:aminoglycoside phosphotransferase, partial [Stenotrophomonas maltophilia]